MVDKDVVAAKLAELSDRVSRVRQHCPPTAEDLAGDRDVFDLVAFNLMLGVQACLDIASHVIADAGWPPAVDYAGGFRRLEEHGVISKTTAETLAKASGLRNIVAHVYAQADPELVHLAATAGLGDLERFAREVAAWVEGRG